MSKKNEVEKLLADAVGSKLLEIVKLGRPILDGDGNPKVDGTGEVMRTHPSAADITAAINWLRVNGISQVMKDDEEDGVGGILKEMQKRGLKFGGVPDVDDDQDDAATA